MAETIHLTVQSQPPVSLTTEQARVIRAVSPTATVERIEGGAEVTITDHEQTTKAVIYDGPKGDPGEPGQPGSPGQPGQDGVSPTITVTDIPGGHRVTITDATGPHSFDVMDGEDGQGAVQSVNGQTGAVVLDAQDVGAYEKPAAGIPASDLAEGVIPDVPVQDVQVNGKSVVQDGVANVPVATGSRLGVVQGNPTGGTQVLADGRICTAPASEAEIKAGSSSYRPTAQNRNHIAAFYGMAKAAGDTSQRASSNGVGQYTESAKSAISEMLNGSVSVSGTTPTINALPGVRYVCGEVATLDITLPASGIVDVVFESGATPTVLTITPPSGVTVKWAGGFDPTALEANTVYEINVCDGLGVAGSWT